MEVYKIPVENIEALRAKAEHIAKKAKRYGVSVHYAEIGEEYHEETKQGRKECHKYIICEVEGVARVNGWEFSGVIEHTPQGNIIRAINGAEVPARFTDCPPYCEHCKTTRRRKDTYMVKNTTTGEIKQIGKTCLKEYTGGLSLEAVALVLQWVNTAEGFTYYTGEHIPQYNVVELAGYFAEAVRIYGYRNSDHPHPTKEQGFDFYRLETGRAGYQEGEELRKERNRTGFDPSNIAPAYIEEALQWARTSEGTDNYRLNIKAVANMEYCDSKHFGLLASIFGVYPRELKREADRKEQEEKHARAVQTSEHLGEVGEKITAKVETARVLTSWETQWGTTAIYGFTTEAGQVLTWKTSTGLHCDITKVKAITGTVKAHTEYKGVKQTELTRVKAINA